MDKYNPDTYQAVEIVQEDIHPGDIKLGINIPVTSVKIYLNVIHRDNNVSKVLVYVTYYKTGIGVYDFEKTFKKLIVNIKHLLYINNDKCYTYLSPSLLESIDISLSGCDEGIYKDAIRLDWFTYTKEGMRVLYSGLPREWADKALGYSDDADCAELFRANGL